MKIRFASLALIGLSSAAWAHNHITIDTVSGSPGDKILVKAGYYPTETAFAISQGRLMKNGVKACYGLTDSFVEGPLSNWFGGDDVLLTSDYFFLTGRLDGGSFGWEIAAVTPVIGGVTRVNWGMFEESGGFVVMATSDGPTRAERSFATPGGDHNHDQAYGIESAGLFDVTFVVWDSAGKFADADPVTIRFRAGEPCPADLDPDGAVDDADFVLFAASYNVLDCADPSMPFECPADLNGDGFVDDADFVLFASAYNELLCP